MGLLDFLKKREALVSIDIGASGVKLIELDLIGDRPRLVNLGFAPFSVEVFSGHSVTKTEVVAEQISSLIEGNSISDKRVVTCVPGPSVFTKKIKIPKVDLGELKSNILLEAGNFIPHSLDAVKVDFHVIAESSKNQLDVLVVAVKNEIIDSFTDCLALAGLETALVDVDTFALQNVFEFNYPEFLDNTVALVNLGARYAAVNICKSGQSLFTGDIPVGGKLFTDALVEVLSVPLTEAEEIKKKLGSDKAGQDSVQGILDDSIQDIVERNIEYVCSELNRQISFFWNASGAEEGIQKIVLTGGCSLVPGLSAELAEKTGIECIDLDPFRNVECPSSIDPAYLKEVAACMSIPLGLSLRQPGDRVIPDIF